MAINPRNLVLKPRSPGMTTVIHRPFFARPRCGRGRYLLVRMYAGKARYVMTYKTLRGAIKHRQKVLSRGNPAIGRGEPGESGDFRVRIFDLDLILAEGMAELPDRQYQVDLFAGVRFPEGDE